MQIIVQIVVEVVSQFIFETVLYGIGWAVCTPLGLEASECGVREQIVGLLVIVAVAAGSYFVLR